MNKQKILELKENIKIFDDKDNGVIAFGDGPISLDSYCNSNFPIVFILQEPYTDDEKYLKYLSGEYERPNTAEDKLCYTSMNLWYEEEGGGAGYATYLPMVSIVSQIFENANFYKMCKDEDAYMRFVSNVAILNVKKSPNVEVASSLEYSKWAKDERNLQYMISQLNALSPRLVIMANIANYLPSNSNCSIWGNLIDSENNFCTKEGNTVYYNDRTLYIDTNHFSRLANSKKDEIIKMAIAWKNGDKVNVRTFKG